MIVLDTHVVLWLTMQPDLLSRAARIAIEQARQKDEGIAICDVTLLEIAQIFERGRVDLRKSPDRFLDEVERAFSVLPVNAEVARHAARFGTRYPKDPMDRLIGASAAARGLPLVTKDDRIRKSGEVQCIW